MLNGSHFLRQSVDNFGRDCNQLNQSGNKNTLARLFKKNISLLHRNFEQSEKFRDLPSTFKRSAFTLAEVLITLAIIGVVAALTIPSVITKYQKEQTIVGLKKVYSELNHATNLSIVQNGPIDNWDFTLGANGFAEKYVIPYLKVQKRCINNAQQCTKISTAQRFVSHNSGNYDKNILITNDGTMLFFYLFSDGVGSTFFIAADINGDKGPNKKGKDVFFMTINGNNYGFSYFNCRGKSGFKFLKSPKRNKDRCSRDDIMSSENSYGCKGGYFFTGANCGAVIQMDNWQIKDDYPW